MLDNLGNWSMNSSYKWGLTGLYRNMHTTNKPITVKFLDKCEWLNGFKVDSKGGLAFYTEGSEGNKGTGDGVHRWGSSWGHRFIRGFHTTVFQDEIHPI